MDRPIYDAVLRVFAGHDPDGGPKQAVCSCGEAIGWSDGVGVTVHEHEHLAAVIERELHDTGIFEPEEADDVVEEPAVATGTQVRSVGVRIRSESSVELSPPGFHRHHSRYQRTDRVPESLRGGLGEAKFVQQFSRNGEPVPELKAVRSDSATVGEGDLGFHSHDSSPSLASDGDAPGDDPSVGDGGVPGDSPSGNTPTNPSQKGIN